MPGEVAPAPGRRLALPALGAGIVAAVVAGWLVGRTLASPDVFLLRGESEARWIGIDRPVGLKARPGGRHRVSFRRTLDVVTPPDEAVLGIRALRTAEVYLDGRLLLAAGPDLDAWRQERRVDLRPWLSPGSRELVIRVTNENGPALLLARLPALELATREDAGWSASFHGTNWQGVSDVDHRRLPGSFASFPSSGAALLSRAVPLGFVFVVMGGLSLLPVGRRALWNASRLRWALILAWSFLALNNLQQLPMEWGFDVRGHAEYIRFIAEQGRLPRASDGWSMFQSPLYYLIAAVPYALLSPEGARFPNDLPRALLLISLLCGALQIQLAYVATRRVFPERNDLQALGTLVGGFLPINLYASQHVGNEPLAGVLSSAALVLALGMLAPSAGAGRRRDWALLGALLGLALLAKPTAALLVPPLLATLGWKLWRESGDSRRLASRAALLLGVTVLVCGWHYSRIWVEVGTPFLVGIESEREVIWWQDPGYRTPRDFTSFGVALVRPIYAGVHGFWDGFYSTLWSDGYLSGMVPGPGRAPPWNVDFLTAGVVLGILPSLALFIGALRSPKRAQTFLALLCLSGFLAAQLYLFLRVPIYSMVKATYTLGLIPAYAVLAASGFEPLLRSRLASSALAGLLACAAVSAYLAYLL